VFVSRFISGAALLPFFLLACASKSDSTEHPGAPLARAYCSSCHLFSEPTLLDRESWTPVLTDMGGRLGVYTAVSRDSLIARSEWGRVDPDSVYPRDPQLSREEWNAIVAYFMSEAPEAVEPDVRSRPVTVGLDGFVVRAPDMRFVPPLTSLAEFADEYGVTFVGNYAQNVPGSMAEKSQLIVFNQAGQAMAEWKMDGAPVAVRTAWESTSGIVDWYEIGALGVIGWVPPGSTRPWRSNASHHHRPQAPRRYGDRRSEQGRA
jgi:hypothetical protein